MAEGKLLAGALVLAVGLAAGAGAHAQAPQPAKKAAAEPAKPAKKPAPPAYKLEIEPRAMDLLRAMSAKLASAKTLSFTAVAGFEYPSRVGPPVVYSSRYDVTMQRPDRLRVLMPGDGPASEFYYDGKTMIAYAPAENLVAVADAPPTIDEALKTAYRKAAIFFPFTDLLVSDPYAALTDGAILAFYIGPSSVIAGTRTDMLAWANHDVFLQVWIGAEDKLPRRIRAVFAADPLQLRHELELLNWQLDPTVAPDIFVSQKAKDAGRMGFAAPAMPAGVKPIVKGMSPKPAAKPKPQ